MGKTQEGKARKRKTGTATDTANRSGRDEGGIHAHTKPVSRLCAR